MELVCTLSGAGMNNWTQHLNKKGSASGGSWGEMAESN